MTIPPTMRYLARRLIAFEALAGKTSEPAESATFCVYEKLRRSLGAFAGVAGFQLLASRALALARVDAPTLSGAQVTADGSIKGLGIGQGNRRGEFEPPIDIDEDPAGEEGVVLIAQLLELLRVFLGEALTQSLLRSAWPGADFDDSNSGNGRKS